MKVRSSNQKDGSHKVSFQIGKLLFAVGICLLFAVHANAQDPLGDVDTPFDGGVSLLVAAGVAYGAKQWRNSRTQKKENKNEELEG